jgi:hypothetical protein
MYMWKFESVRVFGYVTIGAGVRVYGATHHFIAANTTGNAIAIITRIIIQNFISYYRATCRNILNVNYKQIIHTNIKLNC